jgi:hypothetical protein
MQKFFIIIFVVAGKSLKMFTYIRKFKQQMRFGK